MAEALTGALRQRLVLVGAGHAHAQVLRGWAAAPVPGCALVIVSPSALAPYSGMVPGWLAGQYSYDDICIDFAALARAAGATLLIDELMALDPAAQKVLLASGTVLDYDALSLNVGSTLRPPPELQNLPGVQLLALRPLGRLQAAWDGLLASPLLRSDARPLALTAVGGGAAGVESLLAVLARVRALQPGRAVSGRLVTRSEALLPSMAAGAVRAAEAALAAAGVTVSTGVDMEVPAHLALLAQETTAAGPGLLLWATGAQAHRWQPRSGLAVDAAGFIRVDAQLRSTSHPNVLAVGDCAAWTPPLPKAGVFAVRMGPVLLHNLRAALRGQPLAAYTPQRRTLALLNTADGGAVAAWGGLSAQGRWVARWKDHIDRGFLRGFAGQAPGPQPPA